MATGAQVRAAPPPMNGFSSRARADQNRRLRSSTRSCRRRSTGFRRAGARTRGARRASGERRVRAASRAGAPTSRWPRSFRDPFWDPLDAEIHAKRLARAQPSIAFFEANWRVVQSALVFRPPSQAGRRGFEPHRPLFGSLEVPVGWSRRGPNGSRRFFLGTRSGTRWGVDFRR